MKGGKRHKWTMTERNQNVAILIGNSPCNIHCNFGVKELVQVSKEQSRDHNSTQRSEVWSSGTFWSELLTVQDVPFSHSRAPCRGSCCSHIIERLTWRETWLRVKNQLGPFDCRPEPLVDFWLKSHSEMGHNVYFYFSASISRQTHIHTFLQVLGNKKYKNYTFTF